MFRKDAEGNPDYFGDEANLYRELLVSNAADFEGDTHTLDRLVRMQHYSLPTRLLDITSNPLIALYFACKTEKHLDTEGEVIMLSMERDQIKYFDSNTASCIANLARLDKAIKDEIDFSITDVDAFNKQFAVEQLLQFIKQEKPFFRDKIDPVHLRSIICVKGKRTNSRIAFQSGAFLLFGHEAVFDEAGTAKIAVQRFSITGKRALLDQLDHLNINESTVFPYIEQSARYIASKFKFKKT
ncbi:FRG domain-containing protein [Hydrocarboniphaga effusa]|uniref:FRG domain-containing protein n=1 Tax=Hydrocarboniphaga effusa TaxID=243629 RepID=UPI003BA9EC2E